MADPRTEPVEGSDEDRLEGSQEEEATESPPEHELADEVRADLDSARLAQERDDYLDALRRVQADFENYRKRMVREQTEHVERAAQSLVERLLPVLDTCDLALDHGSEGVEPVYRGLIEVLEAQGLERLDPAGKPFDPNEHDAVAHEPGDDEPIVADVMRPGYRFKGRLLRPAMVKVRG